MSKATVTNTTSRHSPEDAATIGLMLLKASIAGLDDDKAPAVIDRKPVLVGGVAVHVLELA